MKLRIYYEDTDAGGVVYHANYLKFMERARSELLMDSGFDFYELHRQGFFFVVTKAELSYKRPAMLGEIIEIVSELVELRGASVTIKQTFMRDETVLVIGTITVAYADSTGRPRRLPEDFKKIFQD